MTDELADIEFTPTPPVTFTDEQKALLERFHAASSKLHSSLFTSGFVVADEGVSRNDLRTNVIGFGIKSVRDSLNGALEGYNPDDETRSAPFDVLDLVSLHNYIQGVINSLKGSEGVITALSVDFLKVTKGKDHRHRLLGDNNEFLILAKKVQTMIEDHPQFDKAIAEDMHYQPVDRTNRRGGRSQ